MPAIASIVEGDGEVEAVPVLLRRLAALLVPQIFIQVPRPVRVKRDKVVKPGELERAIELAARQAGRGGAIFILLDADDDCPAELAPNLLARARQARSDFPVGLALAKCEYEAWFLTAAESLRGQRNPAADLTSPPDPENVRGAKEWLSRHMTGTHAYAETLDQAPLTERFDIHGARRTNSFDKCFRELERLLTGLRTASQ